MLDFLERLFASDEFMPHGHCYLWRPGVVWLHVVSDALIALSYTTIPFTLVYFVRRRRDLPFNWMFLCFGLFIVACGATHGLEIVTLWTPMYWFSGAVKAVTALASVPTAILLVRLLPEAIALPSPKDLRRANTALRESEGRLRAVCDASFDALFVLSPVRNDEGAVVDFTFADMSARGAELLSSGVERLSDDRAFFGREPSLLAKYARVAETGKALEEEFSMELRAPADSRREGAARSTVLPDGTAWFHHQAVAFEGGVAVTLQNVTARKRAEQQRLLAAIVESSGDAIVRQAADGTIASWNAGATRLFGYGPHEVVGWPWTMLAPRQTLDELSCAVERARNGERIEGLETALATKSGAVIEVSITISPIAREAGETADVSIIARDITSQKAAERSIKASLREKEVLLKEVHHRVKNNLQVVSSLLSLQSRHAEDPRAEEMFRESQHRVRSIALFHEKMYQSANLAMVDMPVYLGDLIETLRAAYGANRITADVHADGVALGADVAIPCGLVANELLSNAFKHAFPSGAGHVEVALHPAAAGSLELSVSDDGIGFPAGVEPGEAPSLGLQIVATLSEQIGGTLELRRKPRGTVFAVTFPAAAKSA